MKNEMTPGMAVAAFVGMLVAIPLSLFWGALCSSFALSVLWGWFVAPLFGLPALGLAPAYGLALVFRAAAGMKHVERKDEEPWKIWARAILVPPMFAGLLLLCGLIAKSFI